MRPIRVLLVDDHAMVRAGFRSLLTAMDGVEVIGEAANGREAVSQAQALRPDVVVMDVMMPQLNGLDATARIVAARPETRVLILTMNASEEYIRQALRAGASGYLLKESTPAELEQAVRIVGAGGKYLTTAISPQIIAGLLQGAESSLERLTTRQREVLQLVAEGSTTKEIARKLGISAKTVEAHRSQLMEALDIHDIAGLVRYAIRTGLVSPDR
jgi:DNA-binding NarL/FixJ family response regulator